VSQVLANHYYCCYHHHHHHHHHHCRRRRQGFRTRLCETVTSHGFTGQTSNDMHERVEYLLARENGNTWRETCSIVILGFKDLTQLMVNCKLLYVNCSLHIRQNTEIFILTLPTKYRDN